MHKHYSHSIFLTAHTRTHTLILAHTYICIYDIAIRLNETRNDVVGAHAANIVVATIEDNVIFLFSSVYRNDTLTMQQQRYSINDVVRWSRSVAGIKSKKNVPKQIPHPLWEAKAERLKWLSEKTSLHWIYSSERILEPRSVHTDYFICIRRVTSLSHSFCLTTKFLEYIHFFPFHIFSRFVHSAQRTPRSPVVHCRFSSLWKSSELSAFFASLYDSLLLSLNAHLFDLDFSLCLYLSLAFSQAKHSLVWMFAPHLSFCMHLSIAAAATVAAYME